jgi:hypothetical protein
MSQLSTITETTIAMESLERRFFNIPFENSEFQTNAFVLAAQITPERAYRAIGLTIHSKLRALRMNYFADKKNEIRIGELRELIESQDVSKWDKMRHELEIQEIETAKPFTDKLKNDAIHELTLLYSHLARFPEYTREQFESGEFQHFMETSKRQVNNVQGGQESLVNMLTDLPALSAYQEAVAAITDSAQLDVLRINMANQLVGKENE